MPARSRLALFALLVTAGCSCDSPAVPDAASPDDAVTLRPCPDELDLLFEIDDAGYVFDYQRELAVSFPRLLAALTSGDVGADGVVDFPGVRSLHVGIVSSDMGIGPVVTGPESCTPDFGDDGILHVDVPDIGCSGVAPTSGIFEFTTGEGDPVAFAATVGCVAHMGDVGCGYEQQLDSSLKAVSLVPTADGESPVSWTRPGYRPPVFREGTFGHGGPGGLNDGFLRPDSVLAVVIVSDEEDCSAIDPAIFDRFDPRYSAIALNLRCMMVPDALHPVQRYVDGFLGLRADPRRLVFGAIVGVPLSATFADLSYDAILALPEMQERLDTGGAERQMPSCIAPGGASAMYPPRRIVQVARGLDLEGAHTTVTSLCAGVLDGAFDSLALEIGEALTDECAP